MEFDPVWILMRNLIARIGFQGIVMNHFLQFHSSGPHGFRTLVLAVQSRVRR
ncbi:MAG: hypothetical protein RLZZ165_1113 [Bacteroidota bacterium]